MSEDKNHLKLPRSLTSALRMRQRTLRELELLNEVSRAIIRSALDVDALCELVYREASKILDTSWFHIALFEGDRYTFKVRVIDGVRQEPLSIDLSDNQGLIGWVRRTGRALLVDDFTRELPQLPARPTYQATRPPRSGVYVPLLAGDAVLGTISVQSEQPNAFDQNDLRLLSLIADSAASAIAKARAYDSLQDRIGQLELIGKVGRKAALTLDLDELLPLVVRLIRDEFQCFHVHLFSFDQASGELVFRASTAEQLPFWSKRHSRLSIGQGIVGYVAETRHPRVVNDVAQEPRYISDVAGTRAELAVPLLIGDVLIGVLDVQSDQLNAFSDNDLFVFLTLADQIAVAIQAANLYTEQQEESWTLAALLQTAQNISRASSLDELLDTIVRLPPLLVGCARCSVFLYQRDQQVFVPTRAYGWESDVREALLHRPIDPASAPLLDEVRRDGHPVVVDAEAEPQRLPQVTTRCESGTLLALPLTTRAVVLGVLLLDRSPEMDPWTLRQMTIATGIANQAAAAIESALLAQRAAEQERLEQEVRVAREIQTTLLPHTTPRLPGWDVASAWRSARAVGGDFYDFWTVDAKAEEADADVPHFGLVIADVSDKGVPAALFMALSRSLIRASALDGSSPGIALGRANRWIARDSQSGMFVTLFYGLLNPVTGMLHYSNAGHNPPVLLRHDDHIESLGPTGIAAGVIEEAIYREAQVLLSPGDVLVCYTDGVVEAINAEEEEYGMARLQEVIKRYRNQPAEVIVQAILSDLSAHTGERAAFDDVTLVVLKRDAQD